MSVLRFIILICYVKVTGHKLKYNKVSTIYYEIVLIVGSKATC